MKRGRLAPLLVSLVLLTTACQYSFAIVGDSVTYAAHSDLRAEGGDVRAHGGLTISMARPTLRRLAAGGYETVVVALGNMDVGYGVPMDELTRRVRQVLRDDLAGVECVIWVEVTEHERQDIPGWNERAPAYNDLLADLARRYHARVARWSVVAARHPGWFVEDGVHLSPLGQPGYARFVKRATTHLCETRRSVDTT